MLKSNYHNIACGKFHRRSIYKTLTGIPFIFVGLFQSILLIRQIRPDIVLSFGGYVSVPVVVASYFLKVSSITHEQTLTVSMATRINSFFSKKIALTFKETNDINILPRNKIVVTGNPIRTQIYQKRSPKFSHLDATIKKKPLIYVTGGSQGSKFINHLIIDTLPQLSEFTIIHQTGPSNLEYVNDQLKQFNYPNYLPTDYVDYENIGWVLNNASIVIGRSGANNCLDLYVLNKKAILIPLPFTQQNEQTLNAQWLQKKHQNQIIIWPQSEITSKILLQSITILLSRPSSNQIIKPPSIDPLFQLIHDFI